MQKAAADFRSGRRVSRAVMRDPDFRAALDRQERRWAELCRAERDRVVEPTPIPQWVLDADAAEGALRRRREERLHAERQAQLSARLALTREAYRRLPAAGSLRGRWMAALAVAGDGTAVDGNGTLRPSRP